MCDFFPFESGPETGPVPEPRFRASLNSLAKLGISIRARARSRARTRTEKSRTWRKIPQVLLSLKTLRRAKLIPNEDTLLLFSSLSLISCQPLGKPKAWSAKHGGAAEAL